MKKTLLSIALSVIAGLSYAQTSLDTAQPIQPGQISYDFPNGSGDKNVYYTYTASSQHDELLILRRGASGQTFTVSENGSSSTRYAKITAEGGSINYFLLPRGKSAYIQVNAYKVSNITFNFETVASDITAGGSCNNPIELSHDHVVYVDKSSGDASYLEYTAAQNGTLSLLMTTNISGLTVREGCSGTETPLSQGTNQDYYYVAKTPVQAGKTYIFSGKAYNPLVAHLDLEASKPEGTSPDAPYTGKATGNVLPAAKGTYWYSVVTPEENILHIQSASEIMLPGGRVAVYSNASDTHPTAETNGYLGLRTRLLAGKQYLVCVVKEQATGSDQQFDLTFETKQAGDDFNTPIALTAGNYTTPDHNGDVYYLIDMPKEKKALLTVSTDRELPGGSYMNLYDATDNYTCLATSTSKIQYDAEADQSFVLVWHCTEGYNKVPFTVSITDLLPGESIEDPLEGELGDNTVAEGRSERYFAYTASQEGWLKVSTADPNVEIELLQEDGATPYYTYSATGGGIRTETWRGANAYIHLKNLSAATTLTISEEEFTDGESCSLAEVLAEDGKANLPATPGHHWYVFTVPADGMVTIQANIDNEYDGDCKVASGVSYRRDFCDADANNIKVISGNVAVKYSELLPVSAGEKLLIDVRTLTALTGRELQVIWRDFNPGESPKKPIPLVIGENTMQKATPQQPRWYDIALDACKFIFTTQTSADYFKGYIYEANDLNNFIDESFYQSNAAGTDGTYRIQLSVTKPTHYLIKVTQAGEGIKMNVEGSISTAIHSATTQDAVVLQGNEIQSLRAAQVFNMAGQQVGHLNAGDRLRLSPGVYLIQADGQTQKVLVRE